MRKTNTGTNIHKISCMVLTCMIFLVVLLVPSGPCAQAQGSDAKSILKAMSDYVGSQKTIELTYDSDIEVITPQLEKIQFTISGEVLLSRPDKMRSHRVGGYADVALFFDGKTVSIFGKNINGYLQFDSPGTLDQLIESLRQGYGVALPGTDLLLSNSYEVLMAGVKEAKYIGRGVIDGLECEHLAFRTSIQTGSSGWRWE